MNMQKDIKTQAYVLRRTNYGEADRILNLITPSGKISAIAKGVRKERSKLAGGVEMFSLVNLNIHFGKGDMGTVTSAQMIKYYDKILIDLEKMELAALILKKVSLAAESADNPEFFKIVDESLAGLNDGVDTALVESWFLLNLTRASGEAVNLYRDVDGEKLMSDCEYDWDAMEGAFVKHGNGEYGVNEIKMLRLMTTSGLVMSARVKNVEPMLPKILKIAKMVSRAKK